MHHHFIDNYSDMMSPLHQLPAHIKIIAVICLIALISLLPGNSWMSYSIFILMIATAMMLSNTPMIHHLKRLIAVLPFVLLISFSAIFSASGWHMFLVLIIKTSLSILLLSLLFATTPFPKLLKGLSKLGMPKLIIHLFTFMYRYVYILEDQLMKMNQSALSRGLNLKSSRSWNIISNMLGSLLIQTYERETVYQAMKARGYQEYESC